MPVYVYYGEETYRREQTLAALRAQTVPPDMAALCHSVCLAPSLADALEAVGRRTLALGGQTLVELHNFWPLSEATDDASDLARLASLRELLADLPPSRHVVFVGSKFDRKIKFPKWLAAQPFVELQAFEVLPFWKTDEAAQQLMAVCQVQGIQVQADAAQRLVAGYGTALAGLMREVEKLYVYAGGGPVTLAAVETLSGHEDNLFALLDLWVLEQNRPRLFAMLEEILLRQHPLQVLRLAQSQVFEWVALRLGALRGATETDMAARLKKHPFKVKKTLEMLRPVAMDRLLALQRLALEMEWRLKTGHMGEETALEVLFAA